MSFSALLLTNISTIIAFALTFHSAIQNGFVRYIDVVINLNVTALWGSFFDTIIIGLTYITNPLPALLIGAIVGVYLGIQHRWYLLGLLVVGLPTVIYSSRFFKQLIQKERPGGGLMETTTYAFPSTHAAVGGFILLVGLVYAYTHIQKERRRRIVIAGILTVFLFLGLSRIYLGVHWVSDVVAGYIFGIFWASFFLIIHKIRHADEEDG